jgi:N-acyl amino acid synthase of PEP-CTERM/exosortase system
LSELLAAFEEYFELVPALTNELREEAFKLRYEVMSKEFKLPGFELWRYPDGLEFDQYDYRSVHYLLRHRPTAAFAGTVRLILTDPPYPQVDTIHMDRSFPIEQFVHQFDRSAIDPAAVNRDQTAEVSRLIISRLFRRREGENEFPFGTDRETELVRHGRRRFPHTVLGLIVALFKMSAENGINYWYAGMEPALNRLLRQFCLQLKPIGPLVEYHGYRQPHFMAIAELLQNTYGRQREIWDLITHGGVLWPPPQRHEED